MASAFFLFVGFGSFFPSLHQHRLALRCSRRSWRLQRKQAATRKSRLNFPLEESPCRRPRLGIGVAACQ